jgi:hypothetical protein
MMTDGYLKNTCEMATPASATAEIRQQYAVKRVNDLRPSPQLVAPFNTKVFFQDGREVSELTCCI